MGGERKRKREKREYARRHYGGKKDKAMEKNREKMERYHMAKEDVRVAATTLAPSSSSDASPSFPSFAPSHEVRSKKKSYVKQTYPLPFVLASSSNTNGRG